MLLFLLIFLATKHKIINIKKKNYFKRKNYENCWCGVDETRKCCGVNAKITVHSFALWKRVHKQSIMPFMFMDQIGNF